MEKRFPQWAGFERPPRGRLLRQIVDLDGALGVAYERSVDFSKETHTHARHMIVCPRGSSSMDVIAKDKRHRVDAGHVLWVPLDSPHADQSVTTLYDTVALFPSPALFAASAIEMGVSLAQQKRLASSYVVAKRTRFFSELLERYFFAKIVTGRIVDSFQERQLVCEAIAALTSAAKPKFHPDVDDEGGVVDRSVRYIEANLFLTLTLEEIAARASASVSSLLRHFRQAFDTTPYAYIKRRRLEEARHLLTGREHSVGEVALLVGYEDCGSFSKAFRQCFGDSPKEWQLRHHSVSR